MSDPYRKLDVSELLHRVAAARAAGDWTTAKGEWWACIARAKPRVEFTVDRFVYRKLVPSARRDDLIQESLILGARKLVENLDDLGENAFFAAMVTASKFVCMTEGQKYKAAKQKFSSLDETVIGPGGDEIPGAIAGQVADHAAADWHKQMNSLELGEVLSRTLASLTEKERLAFLGPHIGVGDDELAEHFKTSDNNMQQIRSRTIRKLRQIKELRGLIEP